MKYALVSLMIALTAAGCGGDDGGTPPSDATTMPPTTIETTTTSTTVATTTTVPSAPESVGDPQTDAFSTPEFPGTGTIALLEEVRAETYEQFTRVVFEFAAAAHPAYRIEYIDGPVVASPSGQPVDVEGTEHLAIMMAPAAGVDLSGDEPVVTYQGPDRINIERGMMTELVKIEDFEGHLTWVVGLDARLPFSFATLEDPMRLVVDVHGDEGEAGTES